MPTLHHEPQHTGGHENPQSNQLVQSQGRPKRLIAGLRYRLNRMRRTAPSLPPQQLLDSIEQHDPKTRQMSFTFAVIALSARVACAGGQLSAHKYVLFRESFPLEDDMCSKIRSLFILACHNDTPLPYYISQVRYAFPGKKDLLVAMLDRLFRIAAADGEISIPAEHLLADIAHGLDIDAGAYTRLLGKHLRPGKPYHVLGLDKKAHRDTIKSRYRDLMRKYHPDRYAATSMSPELSMLLQLKSSEINTAYRVLAGRAA